MFSFFYDLFLAAYSLAFLPKWWSEKYRVRREFSMPEIEKGARPLIWVHAVSVGETKAVCRLARRLKDHYHATLVFSCITGTGYAEAKKSAPFADYHVFLPLDFSWTMKKLIGKCKPDLVIITETDFWFHFINYCKEEGAVVALVNGKISNRSFHRLSYFPFLAHRLFSPLDLFAVQNSLYAERFHLLGVPMEKIFSIPNLKYDDTPPPFDHEVLETFRAMLGVTSDNPIVVAGSTHEGEELPVVEAFLKAKIPHSKLLLVPRHPERFARVAEQLEREGISFSVLSSGSLVESIVLIDAMGLLRQCYAIGTIAVVGGSFVPGIGGHNILEPAFYHLPVLFGPHMEGQPEMVEIVKKFEIGKQLSESELSENLQFSVSSEKFISALSSIQGGVSQTFEQILKKYPCDKSGC